MVEILLIEDNPADAYLIEIALKEEREGGAGFNLVWRDTLEAGIEYLQTSKVDVLLQDLSLPGSSGVETVRRITAAAASIPVVVLTGLDDEEMALASMHEGAQDYLIKGEVDGKLLVRAMRYAIERKKTADQLLVFARELQARNRTMMEEIDLAREIQSAFLPAAYPSFEEGRFGKGHSLKFYHRYLPSDSLAGDFFEVTPLSPSKAGVLVCDVMGHGIRAALIAAMIRGLANQRVGAAMNPGKFLTKINRRLTSVFQMMELDMFATAIYAVIDLEAGEVQYASAGHPAPYRLIRERGDVLKLPVARGAGGGPALGLIPGATFTSANIQLHPRDLFLLFTDGLIEVEGSEAGTYFEDLLPVELQQRIENPSPLLMDELISSARRFSSGGEFDDDVCMVGFELACE